MASVLRITESELLDAIAAAAKGHAPEDARTVQELAETAGLSIGRARQALRELQRAGRLGVHRVTRIALDGRAAQVPGYTVLPLTRAAKRG